jgi:hypothetical protein
MTVQTPTKSYAHLIDDINKAYKSMQKKALQLMTHPDATQEDIQTARQLLIDTAEALVKAQDARAKRGYVVEKLEGITRMFSVGRRKRNG